MAPFPSAPGRPLPCPAQPKSPRQRSIPRPRSVMILSSREPHGPSGSPFSRSGPSYPLDRRAAPSTDPKTPAHRSIALRVEAGASMRRAVPQRQRQEATPRILMPYHSVLKETSTPAVKAQRRHSSALQMTRTVRPTEPAANHTTRRLNKLIVRHDASRIIAPSTASLRNRAPISSRRPSFTSGHLDPSTTTSEPAAKRTLRPSPSPGAAFSSKIHTPSSPRTTSWLKGSRPFTHSIISRGSRQDIKTLPTSSSSPRSHLNDEIEIDFTLPNILDTSMSFIDGQEEDGLWDTPIIKRSALRRSSCGDELPRRLFPENHSDANHRRQHGVHRPLDQAVASAETKHFIKDTQTPIDRHEPNAEAEKHSEVENDSVDEHGRRSHGEDRSPDITQKDDFEPKVQTKSNLCETGVQADAMHLQDEEVARLRVEAASRDQERELMKAQMASLAVLLKAAQNEKDEAQGAAKDAADAQRKRHIEAIVRVGEEALEEEKLFLALVEHLRRTCVPQEERIQDET
ncbi:hypothetical protein BD324DRAFT_654591 [Kockovaella imperatae]|uniref:Uncharacterized protein n=1 Tax=Kockovaella imperatae TaxID=4999 RepID=A0A1Y1USE7_9TREE|nr:hypothetical protein BD324DRAFT_654591 [Kockovaella imperatae]ORX40943.1 hypothetical protein BD324DRAFT_654591 [Kockovaella imperatae]